MANNRAVTNATENIFGGFGSTPMDDTPQNNFGGFQTGPSSAAPPPLFSGTPAQPATPPATATPSNMGAVTPPPDPMRFFRNDVGGYNPIQYANQTGINSVGSFLGPSARFGQTRYEGPFDMTPQSIVNFGGQNHNTGLVQNLINQFGPEMAMRMMNDQTAQARGAGGGNWTLENDSSLASFVPNVFLSAQPNPVTQPNNPSQNASGSMTTPAAPVNPNSGGMNPNSPSSVLASLFGLGGSAQGVDPVIQMLMLLLSGTGANVAPTVQQQAVPVTRNYRQYPLFY